MKGVALLVIMGVSVSVISIIIAGGRESMVMAGGQPPADTSLVSATCNKQRIPDGSPFWGNLGLLLAQLVENTPYCDGYYFKTRTGGSKSPAFGLATCASSITAQQCETCLRQLSNDIWRICNDAIGAKVDYHDCSIHYEAYYF